MKKNDIKVSLSTLGCKVNQYDSEAMRESLEEYGFTLVPFRAHADCCIVNTCVVTEKTEAQSRQLIRRALGSSPGCRVIVTGCYAQKSQDDLLAISDRVHLIGNREKKDIPVFIAELLKSGMAVNAVSDISQETVFSTPACSRFFDRTRAFLKIQDGCNSRCSYCIVPAVRGPSRSLPPAQVKERCHSLVHEGYKEVVLTGIHLGAYGLDLTPRSSITDLLISLEAQAQASQLRIRLSSIEPTEFSDELISFISQSGSVCPHVHIPLQSGDETILKKMKRPYAPAFFKERMTRLHSAIPDVNIGIDVIAGFPGETDEQFENTLACIDSLPVGYLHVFPYSRRHGTPAALLADQVPEAVKKKRAQILRGLAAAKKNSFYASCKHKKLYVLVEGKRERSTGLLKGFSRNYIPVFLDGADGLKGREFLVKIEEVHEDRVYGVFV
ncbi:MAG: tRNA (N(6)-L-threonylcarbamoyladenosine(37)-C(2))-methylthiotransferase MtaB [Pseudomonadota bacterium]